MSVMLAPLVAALHDDRARAEWARGKVSSPIASALIITLTSQLDNVDCLTFHEDV